MDALAASVDDDTVAWHENNGHGSFTKHIVSNTVDGAYWGIAVDMNKDGKLDIVTASKGDHTVAIHLQK